MKTLMAQYPLAHLGQQECLVATKPTLISTVLGSCVGITICDPVKQVGGMAHAFMPRRSEGGKSEHADCKFVDTAFEHLLSKMLKAGAAWDNLVVKLFGGARLMRHRPVAEAEDSMNIGERNVKEAQRFARECGLKLTVQDVGGLTGRKLIFLSHTGQVWVKRL